MIVHKILSSLKHIVSKDALREVMTGVKWDKKNDEFVATDSVIISAIKLNKEYTDDEFPIKVDDDDLAEDIIIPIDIIDDIKKLKKATLHVASERAMLRTYSDNIEENHVSLHTLTGGNKKNTSTMRAIYGNYPNYEAIMPTDSAFDFTLSIDKLEMLVRSLKEFNAGRPVKLVTFRYGSSSKPIGFYTENAEVGATMRGAIMPLGKGKDMDKSPKYYVMDDQNNLLDEFDTKYEAIRWAIDGDLDRFSLVVGRKLDVDMEVANILNEDYEYQHPKTELTPEEQEAFNELTDEPGSSDSSEVMMDKTEKAVEIDTPNADGMHEEVENSNDEAIFCEICGDNLTNANGEVCDSCLEQEQQDRDREDLEKHEMDCVTQVISNSIDSAEQEIMDTPMGFKPIQNPAELMIGRYVILKSMEEFLETKPKEHVLDLMKQIQKNWDLYKGKWEIDLLYGSAGFANKIISDMVVIPYELIKYIEE